MGSLPAKIGASVIAIDPKQPKRVYAVATTHLYRSIDAGQSWVTAEQGLPKEKIVALAIDPTNTQRLYAATSAGNIYVSEDGATTWRSSARLRR